MTIQPHAVVNMPSAATEYSWTIPARTSYILIQNREGDTNVQYYFKANANGGGPGQDGNYMTLPQGAAKNIQGPWNAAQTIYFQAVTNTNRNIEIEYATI